MPSPAFPSLNKPVFRCGNERPVRTCGNELKHRSNAMNVAVDYRPGRGLTAKVTVNIASVALAKAKIDYDSRTIVVRAGQASAGEFGPFGLKTEEVFLDNTKALPYGKWNVVVQNLDGTVVDRQTIFAPTVCFPRPQL